MTAILGISAFYHDSAAALVVDGRIVAAAQEERFSRKTHDPNFPTHAIEYCLREAGLGPTQVDYVGFHDKPYLKFDRLLETYVSYSPLGFKSFLDVMPLWIKDRLHVRREIHRALHKAFTRRCLFTEHHESHAASAFFPSPFEEAAVLTMDGVGEWATAAWGIGRGNRVELSWEQRFPHSLGLLRSAFAYYCGFEADGGEQHLMGLAPFGEPAFADLILEKLIDLKDDGSFRMDMSYFNYGRGPAMTSKKFHRLFGGTPRRPDTRLTRRDMDVAASIQRVTEEIMLRTARHVRRQTGLANLCLAGDMALNRGGVERVLKAGVFEEAWIQPAAGDAGGALGVALFIWFQLLGNERRVDGSGRQTGAFLGPQYGDEEIEAYLTSVGCEYERFDRARDMCDRVAGAIAGGEVVAWFQGRMEFGPAALGARNIFGDARDANTRSTIDLKVKFREGFEPPASIVLRNHAREYFEVAPGDERSDVHFSAPVTAEKSCEIPATIRDARGLDALRAPRSVIPAITHVDGTSRVQTVDGERHPLLAMLLTRFYEKTGCPVLASTGFHLGWEPLVCTPSEAYETFMASDIDVLCMGKFVLRKQAQPAAVTVVENHTSDEPFEGRLASPCCRDELTRHNGNLLCGKCRRAFPVNGNVPELFWPHENTDEGSDITEIVRAFYEETPFPNYNDHDSVRSLVEKARAGLYARRLDETIAYNTSVLEVGCGTGQLTNFLGMSCRRVIGADLCLNSLRLGESFRSKSGLERVRFMQMNLFRPALKPGQFDVVLCNGVLLTTRDPFEGFQNLTGLVKPGGHIVIGLYNTYGRLATDLRRQLFRLTRGRAKWIDPVLRQRGLSDDKRRAWFADQYCHPHETKQTFGEVQEWFEKTGIEFVRGVPAMRPGDDGLGGTSLFEPQPKGTKLDHFLVQAMQIVAPGQKEGGFFIMIGKKPEAATANPTGGHSGILQAPPR